MNDSPSCPLSGPAALCLEEVCARFEREAHAGVCDTGRYRARFYAWGNGPPLAFIPGLCDDALSFVLPISLLSRHFRCIAYDLPDGRGDGAHLGQYGHAELAADLMALLDHLGVGEADLYAACLGSTVGLTALRQYPRRLTRAVLQAGFAYRYITPPEVLLARFGCRWTGAMRDLPLHEALQRYIHYPYFTTRAPNVWQFFLSRSGSAVQAAVSRRALLLQHFDMRPYLSEIRQPITLVRGDGDTVVGGRSTQELLNGLPRATLVELPRCGHLPMFTHPEVLAEVVRQALIEPLAA